MFIGLFAEPQYGGQTMVGELKRVMVRRPGEAFGNADPKKWHYTKKPNLMKALEEHKKFVGILEKEGAEVLYQDVEIDSGGKQDLAADAQFVHDPAIMTNYGAIILRMGKDLRRGEEIAMKQKFLALNIPIFYELIGQATAEGGDILWLDQKTLAIGRGFRTNQAGIDQIRKVLKPKGVHVVQVELPYDQGEEACLHLQSLISLVDHKKALVYLKLLPVSFVEYLKRKGFEILEVPEDEYLTMGPNVLAIKPGVCLTVDGNPKTKALLEKAGCKVYLYEGKEISFKAEGGATCLTRPILRVEGNG